MADKEDTQSDTPTIKAWVIGFGAGAIIAAYLVVTFVVPCAIANFVFVNMVKHEWDAGWALVTAVSIAAIWMFAFCGGGYFALHTVEVK